MDNEQRRQTRREDKCHQKWFCHSNCHALFFDYAFAHLQCIKPRVTLSFSPSRATACLNFSSIYSPTLITREVIYERALIRGTPPHHPKKWPTIDSKQCKGVGADSNRITMRGFLSKPLGWTWRITSTTVPKRKSKQTEKTKCAKRDLNPKSSPH